MSGGGGLAFVGEGAAVGGQSLCARRDDDGVSGGDGCAGGDIGSLCWWHQHGLSVYDRQLYLGGGAASGVGGGDRYGDRALTGGRWGAGDHACIGVTVQFDCESFGQVTGRAAVGLWGATGVGELQRLGCGAGGECAGTDIG